MRCVVCGVRYAVFGVWCKQSGVSNVVRSVWCAVCGLLCLGCGVCGVRSCVFTYMCKCDGWGYVDCLLCRHPPSNSHPLSVFNRPPTVVSDVTTLQSLRKSPGPRTCTYLKVPVPSSIHVSLGCRSAFPWPVDLRLNEP